jgi:phosphoenolpyruvate carboxylase
LCICVFCLTFVVQGEFDLQAAVSSLNENLPAVLKNPTGIPQQQLDEFARELTRIKDRLQRKHDELAHEGLLCDAHCQAMMKRMEMLRAKIREQSEKIEAAKTAVLANKGDSHYKQLEALRAKVDMHEKGLTFIRELKKQVGSLGEQASQITKAATKVAKSAAKAEVAASAQSIKNQLLQTSSAWKDISNIDVAGEIQKIDDHRAAITNDLEASPSDDKEAEFHMCVSLQDIVILFLLWIFARCSPKETGGARRF